MTLYIGVMSGTSVDAVDAVIVDFPSSKPPSNYKSSTANKCHLVATHSEAIPSDLKRLVLSVSDETPLKTIIELDVRVGKVFSKAITNLINKSTVDIKSIAAIGSHGQTIFHCPNSNFPSSIQIGDPNIIAKKTQITTVSDFRRGDIALGGQGAPLVPPFHQFLFSGHPNSCILNIGGISNGSIIANDGSITMGFDIGPGNTLIDLWCKKNNNSDFDDDGKWAASGKVISCLLEEMLADCYFSKQPPKSTGTEHFNHKWLNSFLERKEYCAADIQATLTELTAKSIVDAIREYAPNTDKIIVCGGGAFNSYLLKRISSYAGENLTVTTTSDYGYSPKWIEAMAFAWLAKQRVEGKPGNNINVTGAANKTVLGAIYIYSP